MRDYEISGLPFFILTGSDGTLPARNYSEAFYESRDRLR